MSVTRLKRKHRKNIARANNKQHIIKELLRTPVLKNVDLEELKSRFTTAAPAAEATAKKAPAKKTAEETSEAAPTAEAGTVAAVKDAAAKAVDKVKEVAASVAHSDVVEKAKEVVADAVDAVKEAVAGTDEKADNAEAFDPADAVTKPVNADGQEGEHPKPEIAL
ncbi:MAG: hypothetical protein M3Y54_12250 [Bacteroidota bacterium]|nr:hypothetical protein [Bacteroidota bacterium]